MNACFEMVSRLFSFSSHFWIVAFFYFPYLLISFLNYLCSQNYFMLSIFSDKELAIVNRFVPFYIPS